jgi:hypothetical protein
MSVSAMAATQAMMPMTPTAIMALPFGSFLLDFFVKGEELEKLCGADESDIVWKPGLRLN